MADPLVVAHTEIVQAGDSWNVAVPGAAAVGDDLIVAVSTDGNTFATPAGWTQFSHDSATPDGAQFGTLTLYTKVAVLGDLGTNIPFSRTALGAGVSIVTFVVARNRMGAFISNATTGTNLTNMIAPSLATTTANSLVLRFFAYVDAGNAQGWTSLPATIVVQEDGAGDFQSFGLTSDGNQATVGATGTKTAVPVSNTTTGCVSRTFIIPAAFNDAYQII